MRNIIAILTAMPVLSTGCSTLEQVRFAMGSFFSKQQADYSALEENRQHHTDSSVRVADLIGDAPSETLGFRRRGVSMTLAWTGGDSESGDSESGRPRESWRQPIGGGYSAFAVAGEVAFTMEQRRELEAVTAYHIGSGREFWAHTYEARFSESFGGEGPRGTPAYADNRVYSVGATGEYRCLDATNGNLIWRRNIAEERGDEIPDYGIAGSPLIHDGKLVVPTGIPAEGEDSLFAIDLASGETVWSAIAEEPAYASPILVALAGVPQILVTAADHLIALSPNDGQELWRHPWRVGFGLSCAQPVVLSDTRILASGSYGAGAIVLEIRATVAGLQAVEIWSKNTLKNKFNTSVVKDGAVYGLDESVLACIDAETGKRYWKGGRYGYGQLLLVGEHLLVLSGSGELCLVRATTERLEEIARFRVLDGNTWTVPTIAGDRLLLRNAKEMVCYERILGDENSLIE